LLVHRSGLLSGPIQPQSAQAIIGDVVDYVELVPQLLDIVAVVDAVMPQGVAESPELAYDVGHELPLYLDRIIRICAQAT
jgi:hypothetical protein